MSKGFWKRQQDNDEITVESMVRVNDLSPAVLIKWGKNKGTLDLDEATAHAAGILRAVSCARSDSAVVKLFSSLDGLDLPKSVMFRQMLRDFREKNKEQDLSGVRVVLDPEEEPMPTPEVFRHAVYLLEIAVMSETEAFLVEFLRQEMSMDADRINAIIHDLRSIMYKTEETV
jgi:hypothetical protein